VRVKKIKFYDKEANTYIDCINIKARHLFFYSVRGLCLSVLLITNTFIRELNKILIDQKLVYYPHFNASIITFMIIFNLFRHN
jgi:hypothetical protein